MCRLTTRVISPPVIHDGHPRRLASDPEEGRKHKEGVGQRKPSQQDPGLARPPSRKESSEILVLRAPQSVLQPPAKENPRPCPEETRYCSQ